MPNQPEHAQPSSSRDKLFPDAAQYALRLPPPALLPQHQVVVSPPIHHEESQVPQLRSVSKSRLRNAEVESSFMSRVRVFLRACLDLLVCQCSTTVRVHPVSEIAAQAARRSYNPAKENARKTHYLSNFITRVQCFLMPTSILIEQRFPFQAKDIKEILGICVQFKNQKCDQVCCRCEDCGVCPHLYSCSCPDFYKHNGTSWCAHIHVMHTLTKGRFREKVCLYIQLDKEYMVIRHVRAFIQGPNFMMPLTGNCFEEVVDNLDVSWKYHVLRLKDDEDKCECIVDDKCITCKSCRCRFSCSCPDFIIDRQVCQHIHSVAMLRKRTLFSNLNIPRLQFMYFSLTVTRDQNLKYYIELEHEMSFYINLKNIVKQKGLPPADLHISNIDFDHRATFNTRNVDSDSEKSSDSDEKSREKYNNQDSWWFIYRKLESRHKKVECRVRSHSYNTKKCTCKKQKYLSDSSCARCGICFCHYTCSCPLDASIICRHVHAVHRMLNNSQETEEEAEQYIKTHLPVPAMFAFVPEDHKNWAHILRREDVPTGGEQRVQKAVLPPLTD